MKANRFEDIIAWQKAKELNILVYNLFRSCHDFAFRDQIQRASVSIMNNIAEGFERRGNKEFKNFLFISKGSCGEVRSMIHLAFDLKYIAVDSRDNLLSRAEEISRMVSGFIKAL
jgi:four helix bundle protein